MIKKTFSQKCYELLKKVPKGKVTTYKILAEKLGTKAYRAVGNAMNKNPYAPKVPCHRVVNSDGKVGKFASGTKKKIQMLKKEGVEIKNGKIVNFEGECLEVLDETPRMAHFQNNFYLFNLSYSLWVFQSKIIERIISTLSGLGTKV